MRTVAYLYYDAAWEDRPDLSKWGWHLDAVYEDVEVRRSQLQSLLQDAIQSAPDHLVLRHLEELGDSLETVTQVLTQLESLGVCVVALAQSYRSQALDANPSQLELFSSIQQQQRSRQIRQGTPSID